MAALVVPERGGRASRGGGEGAHRTLPSRDGARGGDQTRGECTPRGKKPRRVGNRRRPAFGERWRIAARSLGWVVDWSRLREPLRESRRGPQEAAVDAGR